MIFAGIFCFEVVMVTSDEDCAAPTRLVRFGHWHPAPTGWAKLWRASGAGSVVGAASELSFRPGNEPR